LKEDEEESVDESLEVSVPSRILESLRVTAYLTGLDALPSFSPF